MTPQKIAGVKLLIKSGIYPNQEICRTFKISESSISQIKKKINLGEDLCTQRMNKCSNNPIFTPRSENCLNKIYIENRFTTTKQIKLNLKTKAILVK